MKINRQIIYSFIFIAFLVLITGISRAEDNNMGFVNHMSGAINYVAVDGNNAYVEQGQDLVVLDSGVQGMEIVDISNPLAPKNLVSYWSYAYIANSGDGTVSVINTATNTVTDTIKVGTNPFGIAVSPDEKKVYVTNFNSNNISVIDTATNTVTYTMPTGNYPYGIAVTTDGKRLYVANRNSATVSVLDIATKNIIATVQVGSSPQGVAITPDGAKVYVVNCYSDDVSVIDTTTNTVTNTVKVGSFPNEIVITPDGKKAYITVSSGGNGYISIIDIATDTIIGKVNHGGSGIAVSPDGTRIYTTTSGSFGTSGDVSVVDTATNTTIATVFVGSTVPSGISVTPDGKKVYVANWDSDNVSVIDTTTNTITTTVPVGDGPYSWGQFICTVPVSRPVINGSLVQAEGSSDVYLIENGEKHYFTSPEALEWNGYSFDNVITITSETLQSYPYGDDISISQPIIDKYHELGGKPIFGSSAGEGEKDGDKDRAGTYCSYVNFENGSIEYFKNGDLAGKAYAVFNPFFNKWASMGYAKSVLGYPIDKMSNEQTSKFGTKFRYQNFANGTEKGALEYNLSSDKVFEIHGAIFAKWGALGYANSELGLVTSDERDAVPSFKGTTGRVSDFENGHLHWHSSGEHYMITYMTYGDLDKLYIKMGGTASDLGFPVMDQKADGKGHDYCEFEGGNISWNGNEYTVHKYSNYKTIQGHVYYHELDYLLHLKYAKIEIDVDQNPNNGILASSNTASDGSFSIDIDDQAESDLLYTRIYADSEGSDKDKVSVSYVNGNIVSYSTSIPKISNINNIEIPLGNSVPFQIYGYMFTAYNFFANSIELGKINVVLNNSETAKYDSRKHEIIINPEEYSSTNNIVDLYHEYSHFVMDTPHQILSTLPESIINKIDVYPWYEGWAVFGSAAVNGAPTFRYIVTEASVTFDLENAKLTFNSGDRKGDSENFEKSINNYLRTSAFLWDIYDGKGEQDTTEKYDQFDGQNNINPIIDILKDSKTYVFYTDSDEPVFVHATPINVKEFYSGWISSGKPQKDELKELIKHHFEDYIEINAHSPINLNLYDSNGNHIGVNKTTGEVDNQISGAYYSGPDSHPQNIFIIRDESDEFSCIIDGTEEGTFTLEFENAKNGKVVNTTYENIPIKKGSLGYLETSIEDEQHLLKMDFNGDRVIDESISPTHIEINEGNGNPPSSITNLQLTNDTTWLNWTWTNPTDPYFNHTEIYLKGIFQTNTSAEYFNATGLEPEKSYTLSTRTVDDSGNVNQTWVNSTGTTKKALVLPVANFSSNVTSGYAPLPVQFTDLSKNATSWKWDFGDGSTSTEQNPVHTYNKLGKYTVKLTVKNAKGSNTISKSKYINVVIIVNPPRSAFSASPTFGKAPLTVSFTDKSTRSPTSWKWTFGDGMSSTEKNPVHTYSKVGLYMVKLTVKNAAGSSTALKSSYIIVTNILIPTASFSASPTSGNAPLKVTFTDKSKNSPDSWKWDFGDGSSSTKQNPVHTYSKIGQYTVKLTAKNEAGSNTKTLSKYIVVSKK